MKVCIIGGVAGGATAAARLRRLDENAEIIIFERGEFISFANCGLPYHLSGTIANRDDLLLQTPESFKARFNADVRIFNNVLSIDRTRKILKVKKVQTGEEYEESYDKLILSPGAKAFIPPMEIEQGAELLTLKTIPDMDKIKAKLNAKAVKKAVVIGGGFIGVEVAENLIELGIETHLVELADQAFAFLDPEMAVLAHQALKDRGIKLHFKRSVKKVGAKQVELSDGSIVDSDLVVCAIGVQPESDLAKAAGLKLGARDAISVNVSMQTSDPDIYAVGDAIEAEHIVLRKLINIPLAGPANRQGRMAADHICGKAPKYKGTMGTGIVKVFDLEVAATGLNEKMAKREGVKYQALHLFPNDHVGYYPGAERINFKFLFNPDNGKILGAQALGKAGVARRIDMIAVAIMGEMTVYDLAHIETCYAPPFGAAKDAVVMAGLIGSNIMDEVMCSITYDQLKEMKDYIAVDVRNPDEVQNMPYKIPTVSIPLPQVRARLSELEKYKGKQIVVVCQSGGRSYNACRILKQNGFKTINLSGGWLAANFYEQLES